MNRGMGEWIRGEAESDREKATAKRGGAIACRIYKHGFIHPHMLLLLLLIKPWCLRLLLPREHCLIFPGFCSVACTAFLS